MITFLEFFCAAILVVFIVSQMILPALIPSLTPFWIFRRQQWRKTKTKEEIYEANVEIGIQKLGKARDKLLREQEKLKNTSYKGDC